MEQPALSVFTVWGNFYVVVGSAAAALTGLQFVVIVLASNLNALHDPATTRAFGTPTIVHFCAVLLLSAILTTPWHSLLSGGLVLGACGVAGVIYALRVIGHTRRQTGYKAVFDDWLWHCALPLLAYGTLLLSAITLRRRPSPSLFVIGASAVLLLFIGIHNAWDAVTYIAMQHRRKMD